MKFRGTLLALVAVLGLGLVVWISGQRERRSAAEHAAMSKLLPVQAADVVRLGFVHGDVRIELERRDAGWVLVQPVSANCETAVVASFLDTLAAARVEQDLGRGDRVRYGLDHPAATVRLQTRAGKTHEVACGRINPLQTLVYVLVDGKDAVCLTTSALLTGALTSPFGWRDKRMIEVPPESVTCMRLSTIRDGNLVVRRDTEDAWVTEGPVPWRVDPVRLRGLLLQMAGLHAIGVAAENKQDLERFGLGSRKLTAVLEDRAGKAVGDLTLGFALREGAYYAVVPDRPEIFEVSGQMVETLMGLVQQPRDRRVFPPFDPESVTRLDVKAPEDNFVIERRGHTQWVVRQSDKVDSTYALDPGRVHALLEQMVTMEITEFPPQQPSRSTVEPPAWTIDVYGANGLLSGLRIGHRDPKGGLHVFAQGPWDRALFLLSPATLLNLPFDVHRLGLGEAEVPVDAERG